jgi:1-acyl-sn-glycerol-3-phosphate acyltransferase
MTDSTYTIRYPRRTVARTALRLAGRVLLPLLARIERYGLDRFPAHGPLLVVGNHIAAMEVVLMVVYAPWQIEMMGPGDLPPPPAMDAIARLYGYTPVNRGHADRTAMKRALDVLKQGGIVGIFPEGGIWERGAREAKRGVAWLSHRTGAPILPIGFGGIEGALNALLRLKRPPLSMNVGQLVPPIQVSAGQSRKERYQQAAQELMQAVYDLIPEDMQEKPPELQYERFELRVAIRDAQQNLIDPPHEFALDHPQQIAKFLHRPAVIKIFAQDLNLDVAALQQVANERDPRRLSAALDLVLGYVERDNPHFFTYRFGIQPGLAMQAGLEQLRALCAWAARRGAEVAIIPIRRYRLAGQDQEIVETEPIQAQAW